VDVNVKREAVGPHVGCGCGVLERVKLQRNKTRSPIETELARRQEGKRKRAVRRGSWVSAPCAVGQCQWVVGGGGGAGATSNGTGRHQMKFVHDSSPMPAKT
jgi:hypothetical protein